MALNPQIPKYAFGTSYTLAEPEADGSNRRTTSELEFKGLVRRAIELGCRHFDCAPLYRTQRQVGKVLREFVPDGDSSGGSSGDRGERGIENGNLKRSDFFITSKLPVNMMRGSNIERSIRQTLAELQLDQLDLFLVHAPFSTRHVTDDDIYPISSDGRLLVDDDPDLLRDCWRQMAQLRAQGLVRYVGLSNVNIRQLVHLHDLAPVDVVQNEFHLFHQDRDMIIQCEELDIHYEGYAAFGSPPKARQMQMGCCHEHPVVVQIGALRQLTGAQVVLKWLYQQPLSFCIRVDDLHQLEENLRAAHEGAPLTKQDMMDLDNLNLNQRLYYYDSHLGIVRHPEYPFERRPHRLQPIILPMQRLPAAGPPPPPPPPPPPAPAQQQN